MLKHIESVVLFVPDINAAASWYAEIFGTAVQHENPKYAFIQAPGVLVGFHPADVKCPGGVGGTSAYWEVERLDAAIKSLTDRGYDPLVYRYLCLTAHYRTQMSFSWEAMDAAATALDRMRNGIHALREAGTAPADAALRLQRPLPGGALRIVGTHPVKAVLR